MKIINADLVTARIDFSDEWLTLEIGYLVAQHWIDESPRFNNNKILAVQLSNYRQKAKRVIYLPFYHINYPVVII